MKSFHLLGGPNSQLQGASEGSLRVEELAVTLSAFTTQCQTF